MGHTGPLPERALRLIAPEDRKPLGKAGVTAAEAREKQLHRDEAAAQREIAAYLRLHGLWYDQDAMNRRRSGTVGAADFQFPYKGRWVSWEVKTGTGKLRPEQAAAKEQIERQGGLYRVISGVQEAQEHLRQIDKLQQQAERLQQQHERLRHLIGRFMEHRGHVAAEAVMDRMAEEMEGAE